MRRGWMRNGLTGLMTDCLITQGFLADQWAGHTWYTSYPDMAWFTGWLARGDRAKARKIPGWQADKLNMVGKLQPSPVKSAEPVEMSVNPITHVWLTAGTSRLNTLPAVGPEHPATRPHPQPQFGA